MGIGAITFELIKTQFFFIISALLKNSSCILT